MNYCKINNNSNENKNLKINTNKVMSAYVSSFAIVMNAQIL